ncbi:MAG: choice-of-anchor Q domain-containing protein [Planctomycetota bacterium]
MFGNEPNKACGDFTTSLVDGTGAFFVQRGRYDFEQTRFVELEIHHFYLDGFIETEPPDFVVKSGNYELRAESPAIDGGTLEGSPARDIQGRIRQCGDVDIGAQEPVDCAPPIPFLRGDTNTDGSISLSDPIFEPRFLFAGGEAPTCLKGADVDDDGASQMDDSVLLLGYLFLGRAAPSGPFPSCGNDEVLDALACESFASCGN